MKTRSNKSKVAFIGVIALAIIAVFLAKAPRESQNTRLRDEIAAQDQAREFIRRALPQYAVARYAPVSDHPATKRDDGLWKATGLLTLPNGQERSYAVIIDQLSWEAYKCIYIRVGADEWGNQPDD